MKQPSLPLLLCENPAVAPAPTTPMMVQFLALKEQYPDCLLFFRMGDFYELFFEDAVHAAAALDIALTKRGTHNGESIPMCGVPAHSHEVYLQRLIKAGFRVAIAEQLEDPAAAKLRGAKSVVKRDVIRVITPGTLLEDNLLEARLSNYLACLAKDGAQHAVAWIDMSTGHLQTRLVSIETLPGWLGQCAPKEILLWDAAGPEILQHVNDNQIHHRLQPISKFNYKNNHDRLCRYYGVAVLDGFGQFHAAQVIACGVLLDYLELTQKQQLPQIRPPAAQRDGTIMHIDAATRRNLELHCTMQGERRGSLLSIMDETVTSSGARLLAERLAAPLAKADTVTMRLDSVGFFHETQRLRAQIREQLREYPDLPRALTRLSAGRGSPRDLGMARDALMVVAGLRAQLAAASLPTELRDAHDDLHDFSALHDDLSRALQDTLPFHARNGHFIQMHYAPPLDELRSLASNSKQLIAQLQLRYQQETGVNTLKIRHNNLIGYHVEVTAQHADRLQQPKMRETFIHRQTMLNAARFTTQELIELEQRLNSAADRALALELEIFQTLVDKVTRDLPRLRDTADAVAVFDVSTALAELAAQQNYTRPQIDDSDVFNIEAGRHPVVATLMPRGNFTPNNCTLNDAQKLWLLTGPNMAGKSTFLRQNALIAIMAQLGSFVPAESAQIGVVDKVFSRVGAADDLARGRSTFMVEMTETAAILSQATARSLVILDEIGRGTATYDGLSIAWAVIEYLHEQLKCRTLFATHYHELTQLADKLDALACYTMRVREWQGEIIFLHAVAPGGADRSYGIHVAKLAGLPKPVISRATELLHQLETTTPTAGLAERPQAVYTAPLSTALTILEQMNPDALSPKEALDMLYRLHDML